MSGKRDVRVALGVMGAAAGTGWASGREVALFFTQTGPASWLGIAVSTAAFGLLTGVMCRWSRRCGAGGFGDLCRRGMGAGACRVARGMRALLLALAAVVMLDRAASLGALTLPVDNARLCGALLALLAALLLNLADRRLLPWAGGAAVALGVAFYGALALDPRPVRAYLSGETQLALWDSGVAAALLGLCHGAMNAGIAAGTVEGNCNTKPLRIGVMCGGMMCAALCCANAAVTRGGPQLLAQALPTVLLSARWGLFGFWACAGFGFLCAATTLAAALGGLLCRHSASEGFWHS